MTISTTYAPVQYTGNAVTTAFTFPYTFFDDTDLLVSLDGVLQASGYTVAGGSGASGTVTFSSAPASGVIVTIELSIPYTQLDDYVENQAFPADTLESGLDRAAMRDQQIISLVDRSLKYPSIVSGITSVNLPAPVDGAALVFDGTTGDITTSTDYINEAIADATSAVTGQNLITATSSTSKTVTGTGEKTWVIDSANKGFALGMRLRVASDDGTKQNEGLVTAYSGTSLTINVDYVAGSGTHADWNIGVAGARGAAGSGSGDMLSTNNLSDVASAATAFATIKQAASTTVTGVVELSTDAEAITGTDTARALTPSNLTAKYKKFVSSAQATTAGSSGSVAHGLGAAPFDFKGYLVCTSTEFNYPANVLVALPGDTRDAAPGSVQSRGVQVWADTTHIYWRVGSSGILLNDANTGGGGSFITPSKWSLYLIARNY